jgi:hypothetical protein
VSVATTYQTQKTHTINRPGAGIVGDVALSGETLGSVHQEAVPQLQREPEPLMPSLQHLIHGERGEAELFRRGSPTGDTRGHPRQP